jgi:hypothetical protein
MLVIADGANSLTTDEQQLAVKKHHFARKL